MRCVIAKVSFHLGWSYYVGEHSFKSGLFYLANIDLRYDSRKKRRVDLRIISLIEEIESTADSVFK